MNNLKLKKQYVFVLLANLLFLMVCTSKAESKKVKGSDQDDYYQEQYRPQFHFSPKFGWMNDPNGMVYYNGEYHLFFQYTPHAAIPDFPKMHWGHAVSTDLVRWKELLPAIAPDEHGAIFSGSAVVDQSNTAGFQSGNEKTLISIFTYSPANGVQSQGIAYSNDRGRTWVKYKNNPVLQNQGIADFRDPKVFWYVKGQKWILTLAVKDHVELYSSPNLIDWTFESNFGVGTGAHGGVWECPDLFRLKVEGTDQEKWVLLVNINPGGPNGGSANQYFVGEFDGKVFHNESPSPVARWMDYGKDNYAGVTWSGIPQADGRRLLIGWMSNWQYAQNVPTTVWRGAMTLPRELKLKKLPSGEIVLNGYPTSEFENYGPKWNDLQSQSPKIAAGSLATFILGNADAFDYSVELDLSTAKQATIQLANSKNEVFDIVLDKAKQQVRINRNQSGETAFSNEFPVDIVAPAQINEKVSLRLVIDQASVELFMDGGLLEMTNIVFPKEIYNQVHIKSDQVIPVISSKVRNLKSIWR